MSYLAGIGLLASLGIMSATESVLAPGTNLVGFSVLVVLAGAVWRIAIADGAGLTGAVGGAAAPAAPK
jgi:hypothetical protein